jgi:UDP-N-acetylmuramoyl-tripeptide--D-alanyl-D-alanine ligase
MKSFFKNIIVYIIEREARLVLRKYNPKVIAVTGSVGKTSTKDAIYTSLSSSLYTRKSDKSFNTETGVPLTVLGCPNGWNNPVTWLRNILEGLALILLKNHYPRVLVLEVGADRPGEISRTAAWIKPDIAVITRIPEVPVHVEFFESAKELVDEKGALVDALDRSGILVVNRDDTHSWDMRRRFEGHTISYGFSHDADVSGSHKRIVYAGKLPIGITFRVNFDGKSLPITIRGALGSSLITSVLAAIAVARACECNMVGVARAFEKHDLPPGRMRLIRGIKGSLIIDDSYNASPAATASALDTLGHIKSDRKKIAVLGDMMELGKHSADEHKKTGEHVVQVADMLVTVGVRSRGIAEGALNSGMDPINIRQYDDARRAGKELEFVLNEGDIVLVKGSQSIRAERVVEEIMGDPVHKKDLLVRQEDEWLAR